MVVANEAGAPSRLEGDRLMRRRPFELYNIKVGPDRSGFVGRDRWRTALANDGTPGPGGPGHGSGPLTPGSRVTVRQSPTDPNRLFFDFDPAGLGGRGGASVRLDPARGLASIDGVHKNARLPPRSTGGLLADGFRQAGMPKPAILEAFNVERSTVAALSAGGTGQGTRIGNLLEDAATALAGTVVRWEPVPDGSLWHLRVHIAYP
jgi:hypothetical protein